MTMLLTTRTCSSFPYQDAEYHSSDDESVEGENDNKEAEVILGTPAPGPSPNASTAIVVARTPRRSPPASASSAASSAMDDIMSSAKKNGLTSVTVNMIVNVEHANILINNANFSVGNTTPVIEID
jgi:hypothetical protein